MQGAQRKTGIKNIFSHPHNREQVKLHVDAVKSQQQQ
jgi:hypothetical protein